MRERKTKIVLDADVIIHFIKGNLLEKLPSFLPDYQFIVLDVVKKELPYFILSIFVKMIECGLNIKELVFGETIEEKREYAYLISSSGLSLGKGESACMVYCKYHHDVVGSSNIRDVTNYCKKHGITFLTTNDFLFYGIRQAVITKQEAVNFVEDVRCKGSMPPIVDFDYYFCNKL